MTVLAATLYEWLLFLHVVAAMLWLGGTAVLGALATYVLRRGEPEAIGRFVGSLRVVGPIVLAPAPVLLVALGIWMVVDDAAWDFGQTWVQVALGLFAGVFLYGAALQSRAAIAAERAAGAGDDAEAARQLGRWSRGARAMLLLLVLATADMVFKPGL